MTQVHFTLKTNETKKNDTTVQDDVSKSILTTVSHQFMEAQHTQYIQAKEYERSDERVSQRNEYYERDWTTRVRTLNIMVLRTRDGIFSLSIFKSYQRN